MAYKSDVFSLFPQFKTMIEKFFKTSINTIYSDGGKEYQGLKTMFANSGIQHLISPPYTPQHVASAERRHRHIVETGLTLLHRASLPLSLWSYAFNAAVYLINRLPTSILDSKSPFECLLHTLPNYSKLRVFGCLCYPWLRPYNNHKLEQRSKPCLFLGYSNVHNSYICFEPTNHKIYYSRHVHFIENHFPSLTPLNEHDKVNDFTLSKWAAISPSLTSLSSNTLSQSVSSNLNPPTSSPELPAILPIISPLSPQPPNDPSSPTPHSTLSHTSSQSPDTVHACWQPSIGYGSQLGPFSN